MPLFPSNHDLDLAMDHGVDHGVDRDVSLLGSRSDGVLDTTYKRV